MENKYKLILASASPRRKDILESIGLTPEIKVADIDETPFEGEEPKVYVKRLALEKAQAVADSLNDEEDGIVIAGDTIVVYEEEILQKPNDYAEAVTMLASLRGHEHQVLTGITVLNLKTGEAYTDVGMTSVLMTNYSDQVIRDYVATGEPMDKAGAYGIQGVGAILVDRVHGDYNTVVGLPISYLVRGFKQLNIDFFDLLTES